ncbi:MAG: CPBP family intramembrane metalloprotease [Candidatus Lokiarchaeota archaeon]|nr:CPBP family intramembrane metalloprotease [Candidatus Lokiarchaeota archaeon]
MKSVNLRLFLKLGIILILLIPLFFGFNIKFLFFNKIQAFQIFFIGILLTFLLVLGFLIVRYVFTIRDYEIMKKHEIINGFMSNSIKLVTISFLLTMIMEELIFRFYILGFLIINLNLLIAMTTSSLIFSLYHIHIFFYFKNLKILALYIGYSFFIGFLNSYILIYLGFFCCVIIHFLIVYLLYYDLFRNYNLKS